MDVAKKGFVGKVCWALDDPFVDPCMTLKLHELHRLFVMS
jgi:hypothetical protein